MSLVFTKLRSSKCQFWKGHKAAICSVEEYFTKRWTKLLFTVHNSVSNSSRHNMFLTL